MSAARLWWLAALAAQAALADVAGPPQLPLATDATLDQLMASLAQRQHGSADFHERKYLSVLKQPLESQGELLYDAPDHLEQRTTQPRPSSVTLDHGMVTLNAGGHLRTLRLADYPQLAPLIDSIRATLAGDRSALQQVFTLELRGTLDHWQLQLLPREAQPATTLARIEIQGDGAQIHQVEVQQRDGDRSVMSITPRE